MNIEKKIQHVQEKPGKNQQKEKEFTLSHSFTTEKHNTQLYHGVTEMCHNKVGSIVTFRKTQPLKNFSDTGRTLKTQS